MLHINIKFPLSQGRGLLPRSALNSGNQPVVLPFDASQGRGLLPSQASDSPDAYCFHFAGARLLPSTAISCYHCFRSRRARIVTQAKSIRISPSSARRGADCYLSQAQIAQTHNSSIPAGARIVTLRFFAWRSIATFLSRRGADCYTKQSSIKLAQMSFRSAGARIVTSFYCPLETSCCVSVPAGARIVTAGIRLYTPGHNRAKSEAFLTRRFSYQKLKQSGQRPDN